MTCLFHMVMHQFMKKISSIYEEDIHMHDEGINFYN